MFPNTDAKVKSGNKEYLLAKEISKHRTYGHTHTGQGLDRTSREGTSRMATMYKSLGVQKTTYLIYRLVSRDHTTCMAPPVKSEIFPQGKLIQGHNH